MRLRSDDRGVTVQIGTVLLFAVLIVLLSTYQATVVPQQNEQVEFNHNQRVQSQLQDLRDELLRTATAGSGGSASVALGTRYPVRAFFVNPAPPSGTLRTTSPANVTIRNATAVGETGDYWDGSARNFSTRGLVYEPLYHVYQNPPTTVYEHGVLYNRFEGANRVLADQRLVHGNTVTLVALNGSLAESSSDTVTVGLRPVSPATRTVTVRNRTANLSIVVPTTLPTEAWRELLAGEMNRSVGDDGYVLAVEQGPRTDTVRVVLEPGVYELRLAKVGVGTDVTGVEPQYVTDVRGDNSSVAENSSQKLVVEVRDRYNNPVSGARVNLSLVENDLPDRLVHLGDSGRTLTNLTTDAQGRVEVRYEVDSFDGRSRRVKVRASISGAPPTTGGFADGAKRNLTFGLTVYSVGGRNGGGANGGGNANDGAGSSPPTIQTFDVNDASRECAPNNDNCANSNMTEFDISWNVTDDDGDFQSVTVYVNKSGQTMATYAGATGSKTYTERGGYGDEYAITLVARDGEANRVCEVVSDTANGGNSDQSRSSC